LLKIAISCGPIIKHLKKRLADRAYVYQATRSQEQVIKGMVKEFINRVFDGAAEPLLMRLVKDRHLSDEELAKCAGYLSAASGGSTVARFASSGSMDFLLN
jgi:predicted transcriptional regulator